MSNTVNLTSAMRANLLSLQQTAQLQGQTQQRLSTGMKVNSALDNPASYFAAAGYNQRADQLSTLKDNIGEAIQMIKTADTGVTGLRSMIASLSGQLTQAGAALGQSTSGTLLQAAADSYNSIIGQMDQLSQTDSIYKGTNFLKASTTLKVDFNETSTTSITLSGFDASTGAGGLGITGGVAGGAGTPGTLAIADINTTAGIAAVQTTLNNALATLQSNSAKLAGNLSTLQTRQSFMSSMMNNLQDGANNLTAADTNQEGASMLMLQTRQSLGVTSLSLASQAAQSILRLF